MKPPITVSVINQKGGVLKTSTTINLSAALALRGYKVLAVDLDSQQDLTKCLIGKENPGENDLTLCKAIVEKKSLDSLVRQTTTQNFDIIPAADDLAGLDLRLVEQVRREYFLLESLKASKAVFEYDFIFFDNSPSIGLSVVNSLASSVGYLIPVSAEVSPMNGLMQLLDSIKSIQALQESLFCMGILVTHFARSENICRDIDSLIRKSFPQEVFDTRIRVSTRGKSAPGKRQTVFEHEKGLAEKAQRGTQDFSALAEEFLARVSENFELDENEQVAANE